MSFSRTLRDQRCSEKHMSYVGCVKSDGTATSYDNLPISLKLWANATGQAGSPGSGWPFCANGSAYGCCGVGPVALLGKLQGRQTQLVFELRVGAFFE